MGIFALISSFMSFVDMSEIVTYNKMLACIQL
jgi:hypothetical protein